MSFPTSVSSTEQGTLQYIEGNNVSSDFNVSVLGGTNMTLDQFGYTKTYEKVTSVPFISKMIEKFDATGMDYDAVSLGLDAKWSLDGGSQDNGGEETGNQDVQTLSPVVGLLLELNSMSSMRMVLSIAMVIQTMTSLLRLEIIRMMAKKFILNSPIM